MLARDIQEGLRQFLITGHETPTPFFRGMFTRFAERPDSFLKGPYLSLGLPFRAGESGSHFFTAFTTPFSPFIHQEKAWERLRSDRDPRSTIIATGTGSGKTECFLYPLLDHCQRNRGAGIKAIIIYPMNALAMDQARRFARVIDQTPAFSGLRVGLFVGEGDQSPHKTMLPDAVIADKPTLREQPPDVLLTNYKMLDYLLIRPNDRPLWRFNQPGTLRYLVVDELHTFDGAQGTDLACLIRRLKARLGNTREDLVCIGTSATLGSAEASGELIAYAAQVFQARFDGDSVIGETRQSRAEFQAGAGIEYVFFPQDGLAARLDPQQYATPLEYVRGQYALFFTQGPEAVDVTTVAWRRHLGRELKQHLLFDRLLRLLERQPRDWNELATEFRQVLPPGEARELAPRILESLCVLIAWARDPHSQVSQPRPLLQLRVQLWLRELRRMVARLHREREHVELTFADDLKETRGELYLPLAQCTECHATGWLSLKTDQSLSTDLKAIYNGFFRGDPKSVVMFPLLEGATVPAAKGMERLVCGHCGNVQATGQYCEACGDVDLVRVFVPDNTRVKTHNDVNHTVNERHCPVCGAQHSLMVFGARAASLASVAVHHGYAAPHNDDRRLIAFSDSVQDAAHRAGFFNARTWRNNIRMAIAQALATAEQREAKLETFLSFAPRYWMDPKRNTRAMLSERFIAEFIAPNMLWFDEYRALEMHGKLPPNSGLLADVCRRLQWEILAEFGYRSTLGRSLERTGTAALGFSRDALETAAAWLLVTWREQLGIHDLTLEEVRHFYAGLLLRLKQRGAILHPFLKAFVESGGRRYLLNEPRFMPPFSPHTPAPAFLCDGRGSPDLDALISKQGASWYQRWLQKTVHAERLVQPGLDHTYLSLALEGLRNVGVLACMETRFGTVWGLDPARLSLSTDVRTLHTADRRSSLTVPRELADWVEKMPSLEIHDAGRYELQDAGDDWLRRFYLEGEIHRVIAAEHTGLLDRATREQVEHAFIHGGKPWSPNLLSATPTLEMGIDIGDLSWVLLGSVPPDQANYLQRIGRAGRRDGNAFNLTVASGRPHDLFFYADPLQMMAGRVATPGVFLNASAVIARQLTAFCLDAWVESGVDAAAMPHTLRPVLDAVEKADLRRFPHNFIEFVQSNAARLFESFRGLFAQELTETTVRRLEAFLFQTGDVSETDMRTRIVSRLFELVKERQRLTRRVDELKRHLQRLQGAPQDEMTAREVEEVTRERSGLQAILRALNAKATLNLLTDEGLIPNYAFPEQGITLRSVIWRKRAAPVEGQGPYEHTTYEYERSAEAAISELAPENRFYAGGRSVKIEQVDLDLSPLETWRLCPQCAHGENLADGDPHEVCPRCGNAMWADAGQRVQMIRLRQVMARASDRESRIGDDTDDREPTFYSRQMLADFARDEVQVAYRIQSEEHPFGFEFIRRCTFREVNFGEYSKGGDTRRVANVDLERPGFTLCRHCGTVQPRRGAQRHTYTCKAADKNAADNVIDCLYLYREFVSEAIRIRLPGFALGLATDEVLNSFVAALQLGLKKTYGGKVDHLRVMSYEDPESDGNAPRHFLMLYDSVPGGTGYLDDLMANTERFFDLLQKALDVMTGCECNQDETADGCYKCLFAYRNSYGMESTSRRTAVRLLGALVAAKPSLEQVASVDVIRTNPVLESELEIRFIAALQALQASEPALQLRRDIVAGKPGYHLAVGDSAYRIELQAEIAEPGLVALSSKPDFLIRSARDQDSFKPVAVFLDGFAHHRHAITADTAKRLALVQSDRYWVWSLTWQDLEVVFSAGKASARNIFGEGVTGGDSPFLDALRDRLEIGKGGVLAGRTSFELLIDYLRDSDPTRWANRAFFAVCRWLNRERADDPSLHKAVEWGLSVLAPTALAQAAADLPTPRIYGGLQVENETASLRAFCAVSHEAIKRTRGTGVAVNLLFNNHSELDEAEFKAAWQGFIGAYNALQFLPLTGFSTSEGIENGVYEAIDWRGFGSVTTDRDTRAIDPVGFEDLLKGVLDEYRDALRVLLERGISVPTLGYELVDEAGEIIAEAELAWPDARVAGLREEQSEYSARFEARDWRSVVLDESGAWSARIIEWLEGNEGD